MLGNRRDLGGAAVSLMGIRRGLERPVFADALLPLFFGQLPHPVKSLSSCL